MQLEDQYRFEVDAHSWQGKLGLTLDCERCGRWVSILDAPIVLADLIERATTHSEECR